MSEHSLVFLTASEIRFGRRKAREVAVAAKTFGMRVMLINGATAARADWLADQLTLVARFAVGHEPDIAMIEAGVAAARAARAQVIVALGGGAVIDAGKRLPLLCRPVCRSWTILRWWAKDCRLMRIRYLLLLFPPPQKQLPR